MQGSPHGSGAIRDYFEVDGRRNGSPKLWQQPQNIVHRLNNIGAGLAENNEKHGAFAIRKTGDVSVFDRILYFPHIGEPNSRAVALVVRDDQGAILVRVHDLIV